MVAGAGASRISLARIEEANTVIDPVFLNSPQLGFDTLSRDLGADLVLKIETLNPIRCFKGRGADYFVHRLDRRTPLVTASAGNFGQGLAYAARKRGLPLTVFAAIHASPLKLSRMRDLGAEVVLSGHDFDAAKTAARDHAERMGWLFVEDGREAPITEGAGTIAVELLRGQRPFDAVLVALGNGAMINGIGTWIKAHLPATRVIGVCAAGAPSMERSWRSGKSEPTERVDTIADGIGVRVPVPEALDEMRRTVDDILLVDDQTILSAMRLLLDHAGLAIEPSGAAGVAAILKFRTRFAGQSLATVLCGANVTSEQIQHWFLNRESMSKIGD
jgi:threonine dehydratase